ncbi:MAG: hypothetical protein ACTTJS_05800 [Wolinella sp.]
MPFFMPIVAILTAILVYETYKSSGKKIKKICRKRRGRVES